jgi:hypothetical protein
MVAMRVAILTGLCGCLLGLVGNIGLATATAQPLDLAARTLTGTDDDEDALPSIGLLLDAGLPDGIIGALALRPIPYTRLHVGAGSNSASPGVRGGVTILPVGEGPSLTLEMGHYLRGGTNTVVRSLFAGLGEFGSYVRRFSYTFFNAHAGIELGRRNFTFYVHGGFTYLRATLHDVLAPVESDPARSGRTTVTFKRDPRLRMLAPSAKLGLVVYL